MVGDFWVHISVCNFSGIWARGIAEFETVLMAKVRDFPPKFLTVSWSNLACFIIVTDIWPCRSGLPSWYKDPSRNRRNSPQEVHIHTDYTEFEDLDTNRQTAPVERVEQTNSTASKTTCFCASRPPFHALLQQTSSFKYRSGINSGALIK